jgi:serine/threonine protein kinase/DNA-binding NarL/FixJ family response regulator
MEREQFIRNLHDSGLVPAEEVRAWVEGLPEGPVPDGETLLGSMVASEKLTPYQAEAVRDRNFQDLVIGNYVVLERLGAGGMGTVYKARHRRMKRLVALKVLPREVARSQTFVQRFQREVEAVARLVHPNIVLAFDADESDAGHFLVMEYVDGSDLASEVQKRGPLPVAEAVDATLQAARALDYAHGQGIIHRDVKPANLLRDRSGIVKVADLGLARFSNALTRPAEADGSITQAGSIVGTVDFMPPEQAFDTRRVDHRADVYSLGCTLFFLLTGRPPYSGENLLEVLNRHRNAPIPSLAEARPDVPPALDAVFRRMVAKEPEERYPSMGEVVVALQACLPTAALASPHPPDVPSALPRSDVTADYGTLPRAGGVPPTGVAVPAATMEREPARTPDLASLSVLLVEPSRTQSGIIRRQLEQLGVRQVETCPSGEKALQRVAEAHPRVVVSAMHLADMTGVELADRLRADARLAGTAFILITSEADEPTVSHLRDAGATALLAKPFGPEDLGRSLGSALAGPPPAAVPALGRDVAELRVLVVDDSPVARSHVRGVLAGLGFRRFIEAGDGRQALALLDKEDPDLIVTDFNMPHLDGAELLGHVRRYGPRPDVPVLLVTTDKDPAKLDAVRRLGVSGVFDKKFEPERVRAALGKVLAHHA